MVAVILIAARDATALEILVAVGEHTDKETLADREIIGKSQDKISNCY